MKYDIFNSEISIEFNNFKLKLEDSKMNVIIFSLIYIKNLPRFFF